MGARIAAFVIETSGGRAIGLATIQHSDGANSHRVAARGVVDSRSAVLAGITSAAKRCRLGFWAADQHIPHPDRVQCLQPRDDLRGGEEGMGLGRASLVRVAVVCKRLDPFGPRERSIIRS